MKQLNIRIHEEFINEFFDNINGQIINEKLECKLLKDVAKQLLTQRKEQNANIKKDSEEYKKEHNTDWWPGRDKSSNQLFKEIFACYGRGGKQVQWSKLDDSCVTVYEPSEVDKKVEKLTKEVIDTKKEGLIITQDPETNEFRHVIFNYGSVYTLWGSKNSRAGYYDDNNAGHHMGYRNGRGNFVELPKREKVELLKDKRVYFVDLTGKANELYKQRNERSKSRQGMIEFDPYSLSQIAQANKERYAKILAQMKAKRENADDLLDKCNAIIKKIADLAVEIAKDPIVNADILGPVSQMTSYIYSKKQWIAPSRYDKQGHYSGTNGLLPMIVAYTEAKSHTAKGEYVSLYKDKIESSKKEIEETLKKIETIAKKYNIDLEI